MISLESYRASIGRFYYKAKLLSNVEAIFQQNCYCSIYDDYLTEDRNPIESYDFKTLCRFHDYFFKCFKQIEIEIDSCDDNEIGFYEYLFDCYEKIVEVVESYDASFLKVLKLLVDGDIESNPGPTLNDTPKKGRPKKMGFKGTPKKLDTISFARTPIANKKDVSDRNIDVDFNISSPFLLTDVRDPNIPVGLENEGVNLCFFNSVIQVLYSLHKFRIYILESLPSNPLQREIKELFQQICDQNSNGPVRTSGHVKKLVPCLSNYSYGNQYDAHECLINILDNCFPDNSDGCIFQIKIFESIECEKQLDELNGPTGCGKATAKFEFNKDIQLHIDDTPDSQSIQSLLDKLQDPHGESVKDYICDHCKEIKHR